MRPQSRGRPSDRRAADKCDEITPPHALPLDQSIRWLTRLISIAKCPGAQGRLRGQFLPLTGAERHISLRPGERTSSYQDDNE